MDMKGNCKTEANKEVGVDEMSRLLLLKSVCIEREPAWEKEENMHGNNTCSYANNLV